MPAVQPWAEGLVPLAAGAAAAPAAADAPAAAEPAAAMPAAAKSDVTFSSSAAAVAAAADLRRCVCLPPPPSLCHRRGPTPSAGVRECGCGEPVSISTARLAWRWRSWLSKRRKLTLSTLVINLLTYLPNLRLTGRVENVTKKCFTVIRKGAMRRFRSAYSRRKLYVGSTFPIRKT